MIGDPSCLPKVLAKIALLSTLDVLFHEKFVVSQNAEQSAVLKTTPLLFFYCCPRNFALKFFGPPTNFPTRPLHMQIHRAKEKMSKLDYQTIRILEVFIQALSVQESIPPGHIKEK